MNASLMTGLNQTDLQAVVGSYNLEQYYYPTLFPLREASRAESSRRYHRSWRFYS